MVSIVFNIITFDFALFILRPQNVVQPSRMCVDRDYGENEHYRFFKS